MQKEKIENLLTLIKENPDLRIMPIVHADLLGEDYGWWMGNWDNSEVARIVNGYDTPNLTDERFYIEGDDDEDIENEIADFIYDANPAYSDEYIDELVQEQIKEIEWETVILVRITHP